MAMGLVRRFGKLLIRGIISQKIPLESNLLGPLILSLHIYPTFLVGIILKKERISDITHVVLFWKQKRG